MTEISQELPEGIVTWHWDGDQLRADRTGQPAAPSDEPLVYVSQLPAIQTQVQAPLEAQIERLKHGGEPDISPGDVIDAKPDGTITLDDGITTWNPARATAFLIEQAQAQVLAGVKERLEKLPRFDCEEEEGSDYYRTRSAVMVEYDDGSNGDWIRRVDALATLNPNEEEGQ